MTFKQVLKQPISTQEAINISNWNSLFPNDVTTIVGSKWFIKQLTAVIFSGVTHIRGIFPEEAFNDKVLDNRKLKILNGECDCKNAYLLIRWIKSAFKALDLEYMQSLILEILSLDDEVLEYYAVDYTYKTTGPACSFYMNDDKETALHFNMASLQDATKKIVFALLDATEGLGDLPVTYQLQLRIHYYDDRTPMSYSPDYFINAPPTDWNEIISNIKATKLGSLTTGHHTLSLTSGSTLVPSDGSDVPLFNQGGNFLERYLPSDFENRQVYIPEDYVSHETCINQNKDDELNAESDVEYISSVSSDERISVSSDAEKIADAPDQSEVNLEYIENNNLDPGVPVPQGAKRKIIVEDPTAHRFNEEVIKVNCICELNLKDNNVFQCRICNDWHHMICYKFWPDSKENENMHCYACSKTNSVICADEDLMRCTEKQTKNLTIFRQLLFKCQYYKRLSEKIIVNEFNLSENVAKKFMKKFQNEGLIKRSLSKDVYTIHSKTVKECINVHFHY